jgi:hypothetical protein
MVKPAVVCGNETWTMHETDMTTMDTGKRKTLRRMHRPVFEEGIWRIGNIKGLKELYEDVHIAAHIKKEKLGMDWTCRKNRLRLRVKGICESKLEGSRRQRRPRLRWLEVVEKDPQEKFKR